MSTDCQLSVVIAVQYAQDNLPAILSNLDPAAHAEVEYIFCYTEEDADTTGLVSLYKNCRALSVPRGSLIPHLWRDGIIAARAEKVALGTAHCIPAADWVDRLLAADMTQTPGIGGVIENDENACAGS